MLEFKDNMQQVFGGVIDNIQINIDSGQAIYMMGTYSPVDMLSPSFYTISCTLIRPWEGSVDCHRMLYVFEGITSCARMLTVCHTSDSKSLTAKLSSRYDIVFKVSDIERFTSDIKDYYWKKFNNEFTTQLEDKLD
jgi:hypothetical protein